jgi:3-oxoacyl-[acyl-carrier protein] reductase
MKTMVITGGSRGIGAGMVKHFTAMGWRVVFCWHQDEESARRLSNETGAVSFQADVSSQDEVSSLFAFSHKQLGHLDAVILNAGISRTGLIIDMTADEWDLLFAVNVRGAFLCAREALRLMVPVQSGSLLFISSVWGISGASCEVAYSASKAAIIGITRALAKETAPCGIRVNCIAPGCVDTDMLAEYSNEEKAELVARTPLSRLGQPADIAGAAEFLLGSGASFITGQTLTVDGGFLL